VKNQGEIIRMPIDGELRYWQVNASPVRDQKGDIIGSISVVQDITESK
jgi:PAS domain S-box-containing protein